MADNKKTMSKEQKQAERLRFWKLERGAHKLKNRSSKHLRWLKGRKDIYKCLSNDALKEMSNNNNFDATQELVRRDKVHDKNEIRKQRYQEKIAAKRASKVA